MPPPTDGRAIADVIAEAEALDVGLDAYLDGSEIWVQEITRGANGSPGAGRTSLRNLQAWAADRGLSIGLAFWSCNSALRAYYEALGFEIVAEPDEGDDENDHAVARWQPPETSVPATPILAERRHEP